MARAKASPARGKFITFEGLDGCGKTTQLEKLAERLRREGIEVVTTREPGGSPLGEKVRAVLLDSRTSGLDPLAELALMFASRAQQIAEVIEPAVAAGKWVLCDRFTDSSEAYQGGGRQLGSERILAVHRAICGDYWPQLTILLTAKVGQSVNRARSRNKRSSVDENRFEMEKAAFFERVAKAYAALARREKKRVVGIEATRSIAAVHEDIYRAVQSRLAATPAKR